MLGHKDIIQVASWLLTIHETLGLILSTTKKNVWWYTSVILALEASSNSRSFLAT